MLKTLLKPFASLTLTVILLALSIVLIYAGTWAQIDSGIWQVQAKYFHSFFCWIDFQTLWPRPQPGQAPIRGGFPMLGGYTVGLLLLINLLSAHLVRFKFRPMDVVLLPLLGLMIGSVYLWQQEPSLYFLITALVLGSVFLFSLAALHGKRTGIILIHLGLIVLLAGEGLTSGLASESQMTIDTGSYANYSQDVREPELAIVSPAAAAGEDHHAVIAARRLRPGQVIKDAKLPFDVAVDAYYPNSGRVRPGADPALASKPTVTDADGTWTVVDRPVIGGVVDKASDAPSAFVTLSKDGKTVGSYLVSLWTDKAQPITVDGKAYDVSLRFKRIYHPYTVKLLEFVHDKYTGTDVAKDFASHVILDDPSRHEHREIRIWMNNPLRYRGDTIYQSSFKPGDRTTILQVVRNPGATMPYVAIIIAGVGLILHFGIGLVSFLLRRQMTPREFMIGAAVVTAITLAAIPSYLFLGLMLTWLIFGGGTIFALVGMLVYHVGTRAPTTPPPLPQPKSGRARGAEGGRREIAPAPRFLTARFLLPAAVTAVFAVSALSFAMSGAPRSDYDLDTYAKLPVSFEGRVQPIDSLARNTLKAISGYDATKIGEGKDERRMSAIEWFLDVTNDRESAQRYKIFRIDHPEVKDLIGLDPKQKYFSLDDIVAKDPRKVEEAIKDAMQVEPAERSLYQKKLGELGAKLTAYLNAQRIAGSPPQPGQHADPILAAPPLAPGETWRMLLDLIMEADARGAGEAPAHASFTAFSGMQQAYAAKQPGQFNRVVADYAKVIDAKLPQVSTKAGFETWFNRFDPIFIAWIIYIAVFLFAALSWIGVAAEPLRRTSLWLLLLAIGIHTVAILSRIYISGRPPVTNLANSAVFIGFGAAVFGAALELLFRRGIGTACAGLIGLVTLLIYHELARDGDTMKVLVAVLDTNVWLATHVIAITLGYAATFLAGILGIVFVLRGVLATDLDADARKSMGRMMYGITCFAVLFSFIGTILGGIWADQSWGRFWGWDPKENGAVLIVLANAIVLHARWGGLARERGMANLAIFGAIVTAWSWFGTNMLGVGLHSYGFMDSALMWLLLAVGALIAIILVGCLPKRMWRSYQADDGVVSATARTAKNAFTPVMRTPTNV